MSAKRILAAMLAGALVLLALPAVASATWTKEGAAIAADETFALEGTWSWTGQAGSVSCTNAKASITATKGTTIGHVTSFTVSEPTLKCTVGGALGGLCGANSLTKVALNFNATVSILGGALLINELSMEHKFGTCAQFTLTDAGGITATPDKKDPMKEVTLSGKVKLQTLTEATVGGKLNLNPAGIYGID
jgi:hypothetical protein